MSGDSSSEKIHYDDGMKRINDDRVTFRSLTSSAQKELKNKWAFVYVRRNLGDFAVAQRDSNKKGHTFPFFFFFFFYRSLLFFRSRLGDVWENRNKRVGEKEWKEEDGVYLGHEKKQKAVKDKGR